MSITGCFMLINTERVRMVLMNKAIPAYTLESEIGISRSAITRVRMVSDELRTSGLIQS